MSSWWWAITSETCRALVIINIIKSRILLVTYKISISNDARSHEYKISHTSANLMFMTVLTTVHWTPPSYCVPHVLFVYRTFLLSASGFIFRNPVQYFVISWFRAPSFELLLKLQPTGHPVLCPFMAAFQIWTACCYQKQSIKQSCGTTIWAHVHWNVCSSLQWTSLHADTHVQSNSIASAGFSQFSACCWMLVCQRDVNADRNNLVICGIFLNILFRRTKST
jgi:hypothetical protein